MLPLSIPSRGWHNEQKASDTYGLTEQSYSRTGLRADEGCHEFQTYGMYFHWSYIALWFHEQVLTQGQPSSYYRERVK